MCKPQLINGISLLIFSVAGLSIVYRFLSMAGLSIVCPWLEFIVDKLTLMEFGNLPMPFGNDCWLQDSRVQLDWKSRHFWSFSAWRKNLGSWDYDGTFQNFCSASCLTMCFWFLLQHSSSESSVAEPLYAVDR
jgi:hypothetical protein